MFHKGQKIAKMSLGKGKVFRTLATYLPLPKVLYVPTYVPSI
jgi:hypothetical protein